MHVVGRTHKDEWEILQVELLGSNEFEVSALVNIEPMSWTAIKDCVCKLNP